MNLQRRILKTLNEVGFEVGHGQVAPMGQALPLVHGWALDRATATLALVAGHSESREIDGEWQELFFAVASLRHELRKGRPPAIGTPIVIAIVSDEAQGLRLRRLAEVLSRDYLLFSRVELNIVVGDPDTQELEHALAPLLVQSRRAVREGVVVGTRTLGELANEVAENVSARANEVSEEVLGPHAAAAATELAQRFVDEIAPDRPSRPAALVPFRKVHLSNFRAFEDQDVSFSEVTLLDGLNGTGKSSLIEALEILWMGSSDRQPDDVSNSEFDAHLLGKAGDNWSVSGWASKEAHPIERSSTVDAPRMALGRNVFLQDLRRDVALESPSERYRDLLSSTGLEVPELATISNELRREAKKDLDLALSRIGVPPPRTGQIGPKYVREFLASALPAEFPALIRLAEAEAVVTDIANAASIRHTARYARADPLFDRLEALREEARDLAQALRTSDAFMNEIRSLHADLLREADDLERHAQAIDALLTSVERQGASVAKPTLEPGERPPLPPEAAHQWLRAGRSLERAVSSLRARHDRIADEAWVRRVDAFVEAAEATLSATPFDLLEPLTAGAEGAGQMRRVPPTLPRTVSREVAHRAGFVSSVGRVPAELERPLIELRNLVRDRSARERALATELLDHPLVKLEGSEDHLYRALARYEVLRRIQVPLERAQETILNRLFERSLTAVLGELIAALTRFEWYFDAFTMDVEKKGVGFGGMVARSEKLDLRMLLNAGERSVVTLAWFLALHLLQPKEDRRVLVMDDPLSNLDVNNSQAALATLRALVRLTEPELFVFSTHDQALADDFEREFQPLGQWPSDTRRLRFLREASRATVIEEIHDRVQTPNLDDEVAALGLGSVEEPTKA